MSYGLDCFVEVKNKDTGKWEEFKSLKHELFSYESMEFWTPWTRHYSVPAAPWAERGWPTDSDWLNSNQSNDGLILWPGETVRDSLDYDGNFYRSYVTLRELICFDYNQFFEPRDKDGVLIKQPYHPVDKMFYRTALGDYYFCCILNLQAATYAITDGNWEHVRVIYNLS